jgi:FixJ family two-component response regulator
LGLLNLNFPVILISGYADDFAAQALAEGAFAVLDKPIQSQELIGTVRAAIDSTRHSGG